MVSTHSAVVTVGLRAPLVAIQAPTVTPQAGEVRVRVLWTASTPLDLHRNDGGLLVTYPQVLGSSVAGEVVEVGEGVTALRLEDKVFGFTWRSDSERGQQEFVTVPEYLLGKIPENVSMEAVITVPNNFVSVWHTFTADLNIPLQYPKPAAYKPPAATAPILIWGGATSVGQYAVQLLRYYGYTQIIATASPKHHAHLIALGATAVLDYIQADVVQQISALFGKHAGSALILDCVGSSQGSIAPIAKVAEKGAIVAVLLPVIVKDVSNTDVPEYSLDAGAAAPWADGVTVRGVRTHFYLENEFSKYNLQSVVMPELLKRGIIKPNRYRIIEGRTMLERAQKALDALRRKEASGERLVWRVSET